jgi:hypothetical protein
MLFDKLSKSAKAELLKDLSDLETKTKDVLKFVSIADSFDRRHLFAAADIVDEYIYSFIKKMEKPHKKAAKLIREKRRNE